MRFGLAATMLLAALGAVPPAARAAVPVRVTFGGGLVLPAAPAAVTDFWNGSWALHAGLHYRTTHRVGVWLEAGYDRSAFDAGAFETSIAAQHPNVHVTGNALYVVPITAGVEIALTGWGNTRPLATAGLGYYKVGATQASVSGPGAETVVLPDPGGDAFGARLGLGVRTLVTPAVTLVLDATAHVVWTDPDALVLVPLRFGLRF